MDKTQLAQTAKALVASGKGILAADESTSTMGKRLKSIGVENTEQNRIGFRGAMFTAAGWEKHVSGVILYDETLRQSVDGTPVPKLLAQHGVVPGIKVDKGSKPLSGAPNEEITEGLDGLRERLREYYDLGARFAKWRAVINIGDGFPTRYGLEANAHALARYAALCQEANIVPIVEPEVIGEGNHTAERAFEVTDAIQRAVFDQLHLQKVWFPGMLLKPNMVVPGYASGQKANAPQVAEWTLDVLRRNVPASVPGIVFLSGGLSDEDSTEYLDAMNKAAGPKPWALSFSYGRALQQAPLHAWAGKAENKAAMQKAFLKRARLNGLAAQGKYSREMEKEG
ncbi:MAG: fructose-bisphosphate aldolase, class [Thermoplasmata archaeon]|jgi:fructose-bisphosphate aldolase class I|nr:fructose-bisphosphate aldolase, class [Thermoplasmata archaeon]